MSTIETSTFTRGGHDWTFSVLQPQGSTPPSPKDLDIVSQPIRRCGKESPDSFLRPFLATRWTFNIRDDKKFLVQRINDPNIELFLNINRDGSRYYRGKIISGNIRYNPQDDDPVVTVEASDTIGRLANHILASSLDIGTAGRREGYATVTEILTHLLKLIEDFDIRILYDWFVVNNTDNFYPSETHELRLGDLTDTQSAQEALKAILQWGAMQAMQWKGKWNALQRSQRKVSSGTVDVFDAGSKTTFSPVKTTSDFKVAVDRRGQGRGQPQQPRVFRRAGQQAQVEVRRQKSFYNPRMNSWSDRPRAGRATSSDTLLPDYWGVANDNFTNQSHQRTSNNKFRITGNTVLVQQVQGYSDDMRFHFAGDLDGNSGTTDVDIARLRYVDPDGKDYWFFFERGAPGGGAFQNSKDAIKIDGSSKSFNFEVTPEPPNDSNISNMASGGSYFLYILFDDGGGTYDNITWDFAGPFKSGKDELYERQDRTVTVTAKPPNSTERIDRSEAYSTSFVREPEELRRLTEQNADAGFTDRFTPVSSYEDGQKSSPQWDADTAQGNPLAASFTNVSGAYGHLQIQYFERRVLETLRQTFESLHGQEIWLRDASEVDIIHTIKKDGNLYTPVYVEEYIYQGLKKMVMTEVKFGTISEATESIDGEIT